MIESITEFWEAFKSYPGPVKVNTILILWLFLHNLLDDFCDRGKEDRMSRRIDDLEREVGSIGRNTWG